MTDAGDHTRDHEVAARRSLREPRWLVVLLILCFGGPLNPAVWAIGLIEPQNAQFQVDERFYHILMVPSTVMTLATLLYIRKQGFVFSSIFGAVKIGFGTAVSLSPVTMVLGMSIMDSGVSIGRAIEMVIVVGFFGWFFMIIPFFAITHGVPCALVLAGLLDLFSTRQSDQP
ncbi:MAG: hypothetical protein AAF718_09470 [Pseudomonadota bacterium]